MSGVFTKVCGVRCHHDAAFAAASGADAIGVNFFPGSPRYVPLEDCPEWLGSLRDRVLRVAVVVNPDREWLSAIRESGLFDAIQFHGEEDPAKCAECGFPMWIKAIRVRDEDSLVRALEYDTPYLLLDSWQPNDRGGTGKRLNWRVAADFVRAHPDRKVILAGGLNPTNVREAIRIVMPYGVDAASGLELSPGVKEDYLVREFLSAAKPASQQGD